MKKYFYKQIESYMDNALSNFQCGSRKDFNVQQCFMGMIKKAKIVMDKGEHFSLLLPDLSKVFHCLPYNLLIAKLVA